MAMKPAALRNSRDFSVVQNHGPWSFVAERILTEQSSKLDQSVRASIANTVGLPTGLPATVGHGKYCCNLSIDWCLTLGSPESLIPTASYMNQTGGYRQPEYSGYYWPEVGQQAQSYDSGSLSMDFSSASTAAPESFTAVPAPSSGERLFSLKLRALEYLPITKSPARLPGESQSGLPTSTFYPASAGARLSSCSLVDAFPKQNVHTYHQPGAAPTRAGLTSTGRFQPYGMSRGRLNDHRNAEAGPSTLVPSPAPYVGHPTQPSGGIISETTADAESSQTITEADKVSVSNFYCSHIPRVIEWLFSVRHLSGPGSPVVKDYLAPTAHRRGKIPQSCASGRGRKWDIEEFRPLTRLWLVSTHRISRNSASNSVDCNAAAVRVIRVIRPLVNQEPRLFTGKGQRTAEGSKHPDKEFERRKEEKRLFQELSRYYPLRQNQSGWARPSLFSLGKHKRDHSA